MTLPWTANQLLTGAVFTSRLPIVAQKPGRQQYSSTITGQNDADLQILLPSINAVYQVEANYATSGVTAADITLAWTTTGSATIVRTMQAMALGGTAASDTETICRELSNNEWGAGTTFPNQSTVRETLLVTTALEPCTLQLLWSQNTSDTAATSIHAYSWAVAQRID